MESLNWAQKNVKGMFIKRQLLSKFFYVPVSPTLNCDYVSKSGDSQIQVPQKKTMSPSKKLAGKRGCCPFRRAFGGQGLQLLLV